MALYEKDVIILSIKKDMATSKEFHKKETEQIAKNLKSNSDWKGRHSTFFVMAKDKSKVSEDNP